MIRTLDQNQFSKREFITNSPDDFLIPDITWFENIKSEGWREDVSRTFGAFHKNPDRLHIAFPTGALMRKELKDRIPISDPIDRAGTERLRELLRADDYISSIEANIVSVRSVGLEPVVHLADNRRNLADGLKALETLAGIELMSQYRKHFRESDLPLSSVTPSIAALTEKTLKQNLAELGMNPTEVSMLSVPQSAFFRAQFSYWAQIFQYAKDSRTLQRGDEKLLNDIVDSDYAIVASFTDGLETDDGRLRERYDALVEAIK